MTSQQMTSAREGSPPPNAAPGLGVVTLNEHVLALGKGNLTRGAAKLLARAGLSGADA